MGGIDILYVSHYAVDDSQSCRGRWDGSCQRRCIMVIVFHDKLLPRKVAQASSLLSRRTERGALNGPGYPQKLVNLDWYTRTAMEIIRDNT